MLAAIIEVMPLWPLLLFFGGVITYGMSVMAKDVVSKRLFKEDGSLIYLPKDEYYEQRRNCQNQICQKLDKLQERVELMDDKRTKARDEMAKELKNLGREVSKMSGRVEVLDATPRTINKEGV